MALILVAINAYLDANNPFETQSRFIRHLRANRLEEAKAMFSPEDREKIPAEYWQQFREHPPESLISPTPLTLVNGRMSMKVALPPGCQATTPDIRYEVAGKQIRVVEIVWPRLPTDDAG